MGLQVLQWGSYSPFFTGVMFSKLCSANQVMGGRRTHSSLHCFLFSLAIQHKCHHKLTPRQNNLLMQFSSKTITNLKLRGFGADKRPWLFVALQDEVHNRSFIPDEFDMSVFISTDITAPPVDYEVCCTESQNPSVYILYPLISCLYPMAETQHTRSVARMIPGLLPKI